MAAAAEAAVAVAVAAATDVCHTFGTTVCKDNKCVKKVCKTFKCMLDVIKGATTDSRFTDRCQIAGCTKTSATTKLVGAHVKAPQLHGEMTCLVATCKRHNDTKRHRKYGARMKVLDSRAIVPFPECTCGRREPKYEFLHVGDEESTGKGEVTLRAKAAKAATKGSRGQKRKRQ